MGKELRMRNGEVVDANTGDTVTPDDIRGEVTLVTPEAFFEAIAADSEGTTGLAELSPADRSEPARKRGPRDYCVRDLSGTEEDTDV